MGTTKLILGDCLEKMNEIPDGTVDAIITDLPYGETRAKWDSIIPLEFMWEKFLRIIKDDGAIVLFGNEPFSSMLRMSNIQMYRYDWKWIKSNCTGFANANYRPMRKYEDILVFSKANASSGGKSNPMKYFPQGLVKVEIKKKNKRNRFGLIDSGNCNRGENNVYNSEAEYVQHYTNYPSNVIEFQNERNSVHPTQKPVALLEYLIKTYTNEGDTVLDATMGSGSTGVACVNTNRNFIGIEKDEKYFSIAKERIEKAFETPVQKELF